MLQRIIRSLGLTSSGGRQPPRPFRYAILEHVSGDRTFVKSYPAHTIDEFLRGRAISEVGERTGLFRAPQPLEVCEARKIILWEYIDGLTEMRDFVLRHRDDEARCVDLFFNVGRSLAAIHQGLMTISTGIEFSPIPAVHSGSELLDRHVLSQLAKSPKRPLHWDFCCGNVFVKSAATPMPVILDAMPNHYVLQTLGPNVVCPVYVDIAQMIFSVYCHPSFSRAIRRGVDQYVSAFLDGYSEESGLAVDRATAITCAGELARIYQKFKERRTNRRLSLAAALDRRFIATTGRRLMDAGVKALAGSPIQTPALSEGMSN